MPTLPTLPTTMVSYDPATKLYALIDAAGGLTTLSLAQAVDYLTHEEWMASQRASEEPGTWVEITSQTDAR